VTRAIWRGLRNEYNYLVYPVGARFRSSAACFILSRLVHGQWVPMYIGEGDLAACGEFGTCPPCQCTKGKMATHLHVHVCDDDFARRQELADLLAGHAAACSQRGCFPA
jgi:hypothetical protein